MKVARILGRLMPNLRGPSEVKRRLYANVLHSVLLYGAPVWHDALAGTRKARSRMDHVQRTVAIRVICAYRTVSFAAATLMAGIPPLYLMAGMRARVFERTQDLRRSGTWSAKEAEDIRMMEATIMQRQWKIHMSSSNLAGERTRGAILPSFGEWMGRKFGNTTFRITQLLTGHGCFGTYLSRIGSVPTPACEHCESGAVDSAEHTLQACAAWREEREELKRSVGEDVSLDKVVKAMCAEEEAWNAMSLFAEAVMEEKERRERRRQAREHGLEVSSSESGGQETEGVEEETGGGDVLSYLPEDTYLGDTYLGDIPAL